MGTTDRNGVLHRLEARESVARLREISEAVREVTSELDLDRTLQKVADTARELVDARYAALGVARPDLSGLSAFVVSGVSPEEVQAMGAWPRGRGLLGVLLREPRPLRVRNIAEDPRSSGFPLHHPTMTSFLGVPLRSGDRVLGNFYLTDKRSAEEFSQEDEDIIVLFASHAAVAIENARRFTETSEHLQRTVLENAELIEQLRAALAARDEFLSIATHELKTPATVLRGYAQALLARAEAGGDLQRRALEAIDKQTTRLVNLVNQLLDASRLSAGRLELDRERFDLVALCREVVERFALLMGESGASRLRLEGQQNTLWGNWDRTRLDQVLTNLVSNALKYSPEGGEVVVQVRRENEEVVVSVADRGIGIPLEQRDQIFEPFRRASNALAKRIEGAGLGLHISKEIVEQHGGRMWFESRQGKGSTFYFTLPL